MRFTLLLAVVAMAGFTWAADVKPAANDGSGPRAALLLFDKIVGPGQADKALPFYHATTTRERALAARLAEVDGVLSNLHARATARFGKDVADSMISVVGAKTMREINEAKITVTGESAAVLFPGDRSPMSMVRISGEWKISVKAMIKEFDQNVKDLRTALEKLAGKVQAVAKDIEQGKYKSAEEPSQVLLEIRRKAFELKEKE